MRLNFLKEVFFLFLALSIIGCSSQPLPPEVKLAETQEHSLWKAGAEVYAPEEYLGYKASLRKAKDDLIKEQVKFVWFRDYKPLQAQFKGLLLEGEGILKKIKEQKEAKSNSIENSLTLFQNRINTLKKLSLMINEGRLSRTSLTKAEIILKEAESLYKDAQYALAEEKLKGISQYAGQAEDAMMPILNRYIDRTQIAKWQEWVRQTIAESKAKAGYAIVVSKIDRSLIIYKNGSPVRTYEVGIGRNGSSDKLHAGDGATPEGRYQIAKKLSKSRYYKALLINYPNEEDRRQFAAAQRKGLIPKRASIGSMIEIHGGGKDGMTYGCIALENKHMDEIFNITSVGVPVTIVGTIQYENSISSAVKGL